MGSLSTPKGAVALVTGSTRGIGWAAAQALARQGASVVLNGRSDPGLLESRAAELRALGSDCLALQGDASKPEDIQACYKAIFAKYKRLDILVNNAGIMDDALLGMIPQDSVQRTFAVNAVAVLMHMQS